MIRGVRRGCGVEADGSFISRMIRRPATNAPQMALMWGLAWLIVGIILGWRFDLVPTSMFGYTWGHASLLWHTALGLVMWVSSTVCFFVAAAMLNRHVSMTELFGRMLFAHWPVTFMLLPGIFMNKATYSTFMNNPLVAYKGDLGSAGVMTIIALVVLVWYVYWGYCAFRCSTARGGVVTSILYVVAFVCSFLLSRYALTAVYAGIL